MTMTRHVICCDGTWGRKDSEHPTNVRKIADMVAASDDHGVRQIVYYDDGVGTRKGGIATAIYNIASAAFGWGLNAKIQHSYKTLCQNFNADDEIYLVGFSRGAYTARSLGGLIRKCGLSQDCSDEGLKKAMALYRKEDGTPDTEESMAFRASFSRGFVANDDEVQWRRKNIPGFDPDSADKLKVKFLAVMDTVGALGIPEGGKLDFLKFWNRKYRFHNTNASGMYENICHVVALNETRTTFPSTTFTNLDQLNRDAGVASDDPKAPFKEVWSPGNHGSVGGGGDITGLSDSALVFLVKEMERAGLAFNRAAVAQAEARIDVMAPLENRSGKGMFSKVAQALVTHKDREGPRTLWEVAPATLERWTKDPAFRAHSPLNRVSDLLY